MALIRSLEDKEDVVVKAAMTSLARFGIDTKDKLKNVMMNLKLFPNLNYLVPYVSKLDIMLLQAENYRYDFKSINSW
jgi:hypothetical protein